MNTFLKFWPNWPHLAQKRPIFHPGFQVEIFSAHISTNWSLWAVIHPNCLSWWSDPSKLTHAISEMLFSAQKKGAPPPKWPKSARFFTFGPFYMIFGSVWPSTRAPHQIFVSKVLYLGHKKVMMWLAGHKKGAFTPKYPKICHFSPFSARST